MLRRMLITGLLAMAMLLAGLSAGAGAQTTYPTVVAPNPTSVGVQATPTVVGGLGNSFADQDSPDATTVPTAAPTTEATTDTAAPELAFTGSESETLAYVGSAMIAAGGIALVVRRRMAKD